MPDKIAAMDLSELDSRNDWEHNGYDDSDFYRILWLVAEQAPRRVEIGSTRYACVGPTGGLNGYNLLPWTEEEKAKAKAALKLLWVDALNAQEVRRVDTPDDIQVGQPVVLCEEHRNRQRETTSSPCPKCQGSGGWTNPRNPEDVRPCFKCNGKGKIEATAVAKGPMVKLEAGLRGEVEWVGTFATIYANGYNRLGRWTLQTRIRLEDGRLVNVPLSKLSLIADKATQEEIEAQAERNSEGFNFYPFFATSRLSMV